MIEIRKEEIIVFAGPNGSGKSTITNYIPFTHTYVNADAIKKSIDNLKELTKISDICNVYDNSNSSVKRIFKKRK